jgi:hypothetical protein
VYALKSKGRTILSDDIHMINERCLWEKRAREKKENNNASYFLPFEHTNTLSSTTPCVVLADINLLLPPLTYPGVRINYGQQQQAAAHHHTGSTVSSS